MVEVDPPPSSAPSSHNNRPTPQSTPLCSLKDGHNFVCPSFVEFVTLGTVLCYSYLPELQEANFQNLSNSSFFRRSADLFYEGDPRGRVVLKFNLIHCIQNHLTLISRI